MCNLLIFFFILVLNFTQNQLGYSEETKKISDNSFLIEEAYNQEAGVVQHIQTFQYTKKKDWVYTFVQEWPIVNQKHQFSYSIPVSHKSDPNTTGLSDVAINYRYQLISNDKVAMTPRLSWIFPSGNYKKELGSNSMGFQTNLPLSIELSEQWVSHWNAGLTFVPHSKEPGGASADTTGFNAGTSLIWLLTKNFNLMFEVAWNSNESVNADGSTERDETFFLNPGLRFAINFPSRLQIVPGVAVPIGVGPSKDDYSIFGYLSMEHPF